MTKPIVDISDCSIVIDYLNQERLAGIVHNYPDAHNFGGFDNGDYVTTSQIVSKSTYTVETKRTIYNIVNWKTE